MSTGSQLHKASAGPSQGRHSFRVNSTSRSIAYLIASTHALNPAFDHSVPLANLVYMELAEPPLASLLLCDEGYPGSVARKFADKLSYWREKHRAAARHYAAMSRHLSSAKWEEHRHTNMAQRRLAHLRATKSRYKSRPQQAEHAVTRSYPCESTYGVPEAERSDKKTTMSSRKASSEGRKSVLWLVGTCRRRGECVRTSYWQSFFDNCGNTA